MQTSPAFKYKVSIDPGKITAFCQQWQITELALFGSVLRDDFDLDNSDIDVLVSFAPNVPWTILDLVDMEDQLEEIFDRKVDLVERISIESRANQHRKKSKSTEEKSNFGIFTGHLYGVETTDLVLIDPQ